MSTNIGKEIKNIIRDNTTPMVTIVCITYNHEKYIEQCLEGFLSQNCNFNFEVFIHDDASTDNTPIILEKYEKKYPDIIKVIYEDENQHSKGVKIIPDIMLPKINSKYIALCEGDDYWIDPNKLQMQYDILETHKDCNFCVHNVVKINEDGSLTGQYVVVDKVNEGVIFPRDLVRLTYNYNFQTSSYFMRTARLKEFFKQNPMFKQVSIVGDVPILLYFASIGNSYYINRIMSAYRLYSMSSFTKKIRDSKTYLCKLEKAHVSLYNEYNIYTNNKYKKECDRAIKHYELLYYVHSGNYKMASKKEYREYLFKMGCLFFVIVNFKARFPKISKIIYRVLKREY